MKHRFMLLTMAMALVALLAAGQNVLADAVAPGSITLESVSTEGEPSNSDNGYPSISADGRYIAFESSASNLVAGDTNGYRDIFLRDTVDGTTILVSVAAVYGAYGYGANESSYNPSISGTGQYVAFDSYASNLTAGGTSYRQVFVRDTATGITELVSIDAYGYGWTYTNQDPSISFDGRYVAFETDNSSLLEGVPYNRIYIRDRQAGTTTPILAYGGAAPNASIDNPAMAGDGSAVAFQSTASNLLAANNPGGVSNIFVYDTASGSIDLISRAYGSSLAETITPTYGANSGCEAPSISYGGRYVAFLSAATNLIYGAGNGNSQAYVYDRATGEMVIASAEDGGTDAANSACYTPNISNDGRYVAFSSAATNLTPMENSTTAVYLRDLVDRKTTLISRTDNDLAGYDTGVYGAYASSPVVSACGMYVAFSAPKGSDLAEVASDIFRAVNDTNGDGIAETDADGDGTPDCADLCPDDPDKIEPGACGCGVADTDTDGDGTPDCLEDGAAPLLPDTETDTEDTGITCFISTVID